MPSQQKLKGENSGQNCCMLRSPIGMPLITKSDVGFVKRLKRCASTLLLLQEYT